MLDPTVKYLALPQVTLNLFKSALPQINKVWALTKKANGANTLQLMKSYYLLVLSHFSLGESFYNIFTQG